MEGYIYLIESIKLKTHYLGSTTNPAERIQHHNNGKNVSTISGKPWRCLIIINVGDITEARKIEYYIKRQKIKLSTSNVIKILNKYFSDIWSGSSVG